MPNLPVAALPPPPRQSQIGKRLLTFVWPHNRCSFVFSQINFLIRYNETCYNTKKKSLKKQQKKKFLKKIFFIFEIWNWSSIEEYSRKRRKLHHFEFEKFSKFLKTVGKNRFWKIFRNFRNIPMILKDLHQEEEILMY